MSQKWRPKNARQTLEEMITIFNSSIRDHIRFDNSKFKANVEYFISEKDSKCEARIIVDNNSVWSYSSSIPNKLDEAIYNVCSQLTYTLIGGRVCFPLNNKQQMLIQNNDVQNRSNRN